MNENPQPKNGNGPFKNNQRDDFLSRHKVRAVKDGVFVPRRSMNHSVLAASALRLCPSRASHQT